MQSDKKFAIATFFKGVIVIKVTEGNSLIKTNISFGSDKINSVINLKASIVLSTENGIRIYNKKYKKK